VQEGQRIEKGAVHRQNESAQRDRCELRTFAPIDLDHLRRQTLGDERLTREVLDLFLAQAPELVADIKSARSEASQQAAAHKLKGMSRAIGAWAVANSAEAVERAAKDLDEADALGDSLEKAVEDALRFIARLERYVMSCGD
jgi:HPt (histidine-containing phosphotransfer) domain-containing protein